MTRRTVSIWSIGTPELLVLDAGGQRRVGLPVHRGGEPDHDPLLAAGQRTQPVDVVDRVQHDPTHPDVEGEPEFVVGLDVAVQQHPLRREARGDRERHLTARAHVQREPRLRGLPDQRLGEQGLSGVGDLGAGEGGAVDEHPGPDVFGVQNIQRGSEPVGHLRHLHPADSKPTGAARLGGVGPDAVFQPRVTTTS